MWKYIWVILVLVVAEPVTSCCDTNSSTSYLDAALDMIEKAKSNIPSCSGWKPVDRNIDCADWYEKGFTKTGVYTIWPMSRLLINKPIDVYCGMRDDGGGWTIIQRRVFRGSELFQRDWNDYKNGFSDNVSFWLGNSNIFALTNQRPYTLRIEFLFKDYSAPGKGGIIFAEYGQFWIDSEYHKYTLHVHNYNGTAGNTMFLFNLKKFVTCMKKCTIGGWWLPEYYEISDYDFSYNLNARYKKDVWPHLDNKMLIGTIMKMKPSNLFSN